MIHNPMEAAQIVRAYVIESGGDGTTGPLEMADTVLAMTSCPFMDNGHECPWCLDEVKEAALLLKRFATRNNK